MKKFQGKKYAFFSESPAFATVGDQAVHNCPRERINFNMNAYIFECLPLCFTYGHCNCRCYRQVSPL